MKENMVLIHKATQDRPNQNNCSALLKLTLLFKLWAINSSRIIIPFSKPNLFNKVQQLF